MWTLNLETKKGGLMMGLACGLLSAFWTASAADRVAWAGDDVQKRNADCIKPYAANPRYWQYKGQPVLLLGGSKTDHIFLLDDLKPHLDEIAQAGANYVRNTMSQREGVDLKPHARRADGKFNLDEWNADYWQRFADCLEWCRQRDIIVQIEVWDRFDYSRENWQHSPWRPANNVNYRGEQTGLADKYPLHPSSDRHPFFHTVPGMERYEPQYDLLRRHQERFVEKMLSYSLPYGNVLYCMNNETSTPPAWGQYWMQFIRDRAAKAGVAVYATDMFDDGWKPEQSEKLRQSLDNPQLYPFIDISQVNSRNFNQAHWDRHAWVYAQLAKSPRPLNHTKIYSAGETSFGSGTPKDGVERFWRNVIGGAASSRFHRPTSGIGLNDVAKACIAAARKAESVVKLWDVQPRMDLLSDREADEAYLAARPGAQYLLYFTDGGSVKLDLRKAEGRLRLKWINLATGQWQGEATLRGGAVTGIQAPASGGWAAAIVKRSE